MTLLELLVVVLVLFSLLSVLFLGARAWRRIIDKDVSHPLLLLEQATDAKTTALCFQNQRQYEQALLKYQACKDLGEDSPVDPVRVLIHDGLDPSKLKCPQGGAYIFSKTVQPVGTPSIGCEHPEHKKEVLTVER